MYYLLRVEQPQPARTARARELPLCDDVDSVTVWCVTRADRARCIFPHFTSFRS